MRHFAGAEASRLIAARVLKGKMHCVGASDRVQGANARLTHEQLASAVEQCVPD